MYLRICVYITQFNQGRYLTKYTKQDQGNRQGHTDGPRLTACVLGGLGEGLGARGAGLGVLGGGLVGLGNGLGEGLAASSPVCTKEDEGRQCRFAKQACSSDRKNRAEHYKQSDLSQSPVANEPRRGIS